MRAFWIVLILVALILLVALGMILMPLAAASEQGAAYSPGNVLTVVSSLPPACAEGNIVILSAPAPAPGGVLYRCVNNAFVSILPAGTKTIAGLANNVPTPILVVSVPNAASAAVLDLTLSGSLGAGGAVGPYEASIGAHVLVTITRTPGLATVKNLVIQPAPDARVAGGAAISQDVTLSANVGANNVTQSFTINYSLSRQTGNATNHIASATSRVVSPALTLISVN